MRLVIAALALAALAGCGFTPMYAPGGGGALIGPVSIAEVPTKTGHALRTELTRLLAAERNGPVRRLEVRAGESIQPLGLRVDESASREDLATNASYTLYDVDGRPLVSGAVYATVSYDLPGSAYGAAAAQQDARERAGVVLAQRIRTDLAIRLEQLKHAPKPVQTLPDTPAPAAAPPPPTGVPGARDGVVVAPAVPPKS